jgi:hypothetical protein
MALPWLDVDCDSLRPFTPSSHFRFFSAEDWNLANPLQTCQLIVERKGDVLVLAFLAGGSLFCQSVLDYSITRSGNRGVMMDQLVEAAVDTSRYFVTRIQGPKGSSIQQTALIGFGFRERDTAVDFRESLQFYQRAMEREQQADEIRHNSTDYSIPKLGENEKIHVNLKSGGSSKVSSTITRTSPSHSGGGSVPLLLKKPPPPSSSATPTEESTAYSATDSTECLSNSLGRKKIEEVEKKQEAGGDDRDDHDDDDDWAEFQSAS